MLAFSGSPSPSVGACDGPSYTGPVVPDPIDDFPLVYPDMEPDDNGLVGVGGRLTPELVIAMYSRGVFPWTGEHPIPWFSPDPRMVLEPPRFRTSRSLGKTLRGGELEVQMDTRFVEVMVECATTPRPGQDGTWITPNIHTVYGQLHGQGLAHSVEVVDGDGALVGGLYGVSLGLAFFGESMFYRRRDASKVALWALCQVLQEGGFHLIDCQQETEHLRSLGATPIPRADYLTRLRVALAHPTRRGPWTQWAQRIPTPRSASEQA